MEKLTKKEKREQRREEREQYQIELDKQQEKKKFFTWGAVVVVLLVSAFGLYKLATAPAPLQSSQGDTSGDAKAAPLSPTDITIGNKKAKAVIVEYADFECPGCKAAYPLLKQLMQEDGNNVLFTYRFFPLIQIHKNAMVSAQAAYAAYKQNKFWEMHDLLFDNQDPNGQTGWVASDDPLKAYFTDYAKKLGLDMNQFQKDYDSDEAKSFINDQENTGLNNNISHTPTIFLNGKEIDEQAQTYDQLKALVDQATK